MKSSYRNVLMTAVCVVITGWVSGCANPAKPKAMTVYDAMVQKVHKHSVRITVTGGKAPESTGLATVSNEAFAEAVANSIVESKLFSEIKKGDGGDYLLNVDIFSIEQQPIGFNLTSRMEAGWTLVEAATGKQVMRKVIKTTRTATVGEAFAAVARTRVATEGAAKNNIREAIEEISKLDL
jgi:hypothetical protein